MSDETMQYIIVAIVLIGYWFFLYKAIKSEK